MHAASVPEVISALPLAEATCCLFREIMDDQRLTELLNKHRGRSFEKVITFPVMVRMIGDAVPQEGGTANRAFGHALQEGNLEASMVAAYVQLTRFPAFPAMYRELLTQGAQRFAGNGRKVQV